MKTLTKIRIALSLFILLLLLSGITAFPLKAEIEFLVRHIDLFPTEMQAWILSLQQDINSTPLSVLYGTDWLAFAHIIISLFFIPVFIDPLKNRSNIVVGMTACLLVFPLAFICGPLRDIPFFHQLIDCSFGVFGFAFLYYIFYQINQLKKSHEKFSV